MSKTKKKKKKAPVAKPNILTISLPKNQVDAILAEDDHKSIPFVKLCSAGESVRVELWHQHRVPGCPQNDLRFENTPSYCIHCTSLGFIESVCQEIESICPSALMNDFNRPSANSSVTPSGGGDEAEDGASITISLDDLEDQSPSEDATNGSAHPCDREDPYSYTLPF